MNPLWDIKKKKKMTPPICQYSTQQQSGRSRNFQWGRILNTFQEEKRRHLGAHTHSQAPCFCKIKGVRTCLCKNKRGARRGALSKSAHDDNTK